MCVGIELNTKLSSLSLTCKDNVSTSQQEVKEVEMKKDMELMKTLLQKVEGKIKELLIEGYYLLSPSSHLLTCYSLIR